MPKPAIGVHLRPGSNVYQWRIKVHDSVKHLYPGKTWARRQSLGTSSLVEANAKAVGLYADYLAECERERNGLTVIDKLTPEHGRVIGDEALRTLLADEATRLDPNRRHMLRPIRELGINGMQSFALDLGLSFDENTPGASEAFAHFLNTIEGPLRAKLAELPAAPPKPTKVYRLREVFDLWKASKAAGLKTDSIKARERALVFYEDFTGNPPINEISRFQGDEFRAWLIAKGGASKTASERLMYVNSLFAYAHQDLELLSRNPWRGISIDNATETRRYPWTPNQINTFFSQPLFTSYALPKRAARAGADAAYWIPLLGLFTGARSGEFCQLQVSDIVQEQDIWVIDINETEGGKRVKTDASWRKVPIHSKLIQLGFLDYVEAVRNAGHASLWPHLHLNPEKPSLGFSRWFNECPRKAVGVEIPDFHSLRHTVRSALSAANVPVTDQDNITGHAVQGSTGEKVYRHVELAKLRQGVEKIVYPSLSLNRVYKPPSISDFSTEEFTPKP